MTPAPATDFLSDIANEPASTGILIGARFHPERFAPEQLPFQMPSSLEKAVLKRQADFAAGRLLAMKAQKAMGVVPRFLPIGARRAPLWPEGVAGSISHSSNHVMVWLVNSPSVLVGLDIERPAQGRALEAICHSVLSSAEQTVLGHSEKALTAAFSAKETLYKALSSRVGSFFGFDAARVAQASPQSIRLALTKDLSPEFLKGQSFDIEVEDWRGLICTRVKVALQ